MQILGEEYTPQQETCERNTFHALLNLHLEGVKNLCKEIGVNFDQCPDFELEMILEDYLINYTDEE